MGWVIHITGYSPSSLAYNTSKHRVALTLAKILPDNGTDHVFQMARTLTPLRSNAKDSATFPTQVGRRPGLVYSGIQHQQTLTVTRSS